MNISTINDKMYMTYDIYFKHPVQTLELKLNMIVAKNPQLINSLNRSHIHPLIRKILILLNKSFQIFLSK